MKLTQNINYNVYNNALLNKRSAFSSKNSPSFTGNITTHVQDAASNIIDSGAQRIAQKGKDGISSAASGFWRKAIKFIKENLIEGQDVTYKYQNEVLNELKQNFGSTFLDCVDDINRYNDVILSSNSPVFAKLNKIRHKGIDNKKFKVIQDSENNSIVFHKDPFLKNVFKGVKEFTAGTVLDLCISGRNLFRKVNARFGTSDVISTTQKSGNFFNTLLDRRIAEKEAQDSFYKLTGVFEKVKDGVDEIAARKMLSSSDLSKAEMNDAIKESIKKLAHDSMGSASKKVGKYNTKSERAWNRLGTGFVSATFAATDFYNISMLQNNDEDKAKASGKKRFMQDMRRQGLTAAITYVILGAFQKKTNSSLLYAALSLGGVTLISEILSRVMGKIPLTPLSPEEAAKLGEKKENEKNAENKENKAAPAKQDVNNPFKTTAQAGMAEAENSAAASNAANSNNLDVFKVFTDKINNYSVNSPVYFTAKSNGQQEPAPNQEKKKSNVGTKILKGVLGAIGLSLGVGLLRTKNVFGIDTAIKTLSKKYNAAIDKITQRRLILAKDDVDGFLNFLKDNNFHKQHEELVNSLKFATESGAKNGQSSIVRKYLPKNEINPDGLYYDFGFVTSKGKKTAVNLLLYPVNTVAKLFSKGNNLVKGLFGVKTQPPIDKDKDRKMAVAFIEKYANRYKDAAIKDDTKYAFRKEIEDAFSRHFSEANSQNKNTTLAMVSRFLITIISGYFFVNDYRNEVLIESKGQDVERANATMKERIGHKVANFFLNSMFMDLFNTTFENIYLSSVAGATAVAMATEFTNESAVRASICTPTRKMNRDELIEYEDKRLNDQGPKGDYYRGFMKLTGKKPLSAKAKN